MKKIISLLIIVIFIVGCDIADSPKALDENLETVVEYYDNGQKKKEYTIKNLPTRWKFHGLNREWYENGQLKNEINYVEHKQHGLSKRWDKNGNLKYVMEFVDGERIMEIEFVDGKRITGLTLFLYDKIEFVDGKRITELQKTYQYYDNGQKKKEYTRNNSLLGINFHGLHQSWYENGQLAIEKNYVNGKSHGLNREWYENGQLKAKGNYVNGEKHGLFQAWYENGQLKQEFNWVNGQLQGLSRAWHENGQMAVEGNFENDEMTLEKKWDEDGNSIE